VDPVVGVDLPEDVAEVGVDRMGADFEEVGDLRVRLAHGGPGQDIGFHGGQHHACGDAAFVLMETPVCEVEVIAIGAEQPGFIIRCFALLGCEQADGGALVVGAVQRRGYAVVTSGLAGPEVEAPLLLWRERGAVQFLPRERIHRTGGAVEHRVVAVIAALEIFADDVRLDVVEDGEAFFRLRLLWSVRILKETLSKPKPRMSPRNTSNSAVVFAALSHACM
jgi:hypothetical protein